MPDVNMPKLSDTMEEGTVLEWKVQDGQEVKKGEAIAEIESDKASFEIEAESDGPLHIVVAQGQSAPVGQLIATIGAAAPAKPAPKEEEAEAPKPEPAKPQTPSAEPSEASGKEAPERTTAEEPETAPAQEPAEEPAAAPAQAE